MSIDTATPWHKASFDQFLGERLPQLLAERLPLGGYHVEPEGPYTCCVTVTLATDSGDLPLVYSGIPRPDEQGIFDIDGGRRVVIPLASTEELDVAEVRCAGEQLYGYIAERLGQAPARLPWDEGLALAWLPLNTWAREFLTPAEGDSAAHISSAQLSVRGSRRSEYGLHLHDRRRRCHPRRAAGGVGRAPRGDTGPLGIDDTVPGARRRAAPADGRQYATPVAGPARS
jgi:hypothetical protein